MAQVKKARVRKAIMTGAFEVFSKQDYVSTSLVDIASCVGVAPSSIYVYFPSKATLLWAVLKSWLIDQLDRLERRLDDFEDSRARMEHFLYGLWGDIPLQGKLALNLIQGAALSGPDETEGREVLAYFEMRLKRMLSTCLPEDQEDRRHHINRLSQLVVLAFHGYVVSGCAGTQRGMLNEQIEYVTSWLWDASADQTTQPGLRPTHTTEAALWI